MSALQPFIETHAPSARVKPAPSDLVARFRGVLPDSLLDLWSTVGLGFYGDGLIQLVNPEEYANVLTGWLLLPAPNPNRVPIALSAFGTIFYYRKLAEDAEDVALINPHLHQSDVLDWSLSDFFNGTLCDPDGGSELLEPELLMACLTRHGPLAENQMYYPVPALALGGAMHADSMDRGDARVHLEFLLQLAQG
jgi:hypothetical protein